MRRIGEYARAAAEAATKIRRVEPVARPASRVPAQDWRERMLEQAELGEIAIAWRDADEAARRQIVAELVAKAEEG
jgi:hypothetical protein